VPLTCSVPIRSRAAQINYTKVQIVLPLDLVFVSRSTLCFSLVIFRCILRPHSTSPSTRYSSRCLYHSCFNSLTSALFPLFSNPSFFCFVLFHSYFVNNQSARRADGLSISLPCTPVPPSINVPVFCPMLPPFVTYHMLSPFPLMPLSPLNC
jgi:hypothetical protein